MEKWHVLRANTKKKLQQNLRNRKFWFRSWRIISESTNRKRSAWVRISWACPYLDWLIFRCWRQGCQNKTKQKWWRVEQESCTIFGISLLRNVIFNNALSPNIDEYIYYAFSNGLLIIHIEIKHKLQASWEILAILSAINENTHSEKSTIVCAIKSFDVKLWSWELGISIGLEEKLAVVHLGIYI